MPGPELREAAAAEELAEALRRDFFVEESSDAAAEEAVASGANAPLAGAANLPGRGPPPGAAGAKAGRSLISSTPLTLSLLLILRASLCAFNLKVVMHRPRFECLFSMTLLQGPRRGPQTLHGPERDPPPREPAPRAAPRRTDRHPRALPPPVRRGAAAVRAVEARAHGGRGRQNTLKTSQGDIPP